MLRLIKGKYKENGLSKINWLVGDGDIFFLVKIDKTCNKRL